MGTFAIDSVGFSGTTSLTSILNSLPNAKAVHGTRNFKKESAMGVDDTPPETFFGDLKDASEEYETVAAVHFNIDPLVTRSHCRDLGIEHIGLVRRTEDQIFSCFHWFTRKVLSGSENEWRVSVSSAQQFFENDMLKNIGAPHNFSNIAYLFAMRHVLAYNAGMFLADVKTLQTEQLLADGALFRATFDVGEDVRISHFEGDAFRKNSHVDKDGLGDILTPPNIECLNEKIIVNIGNIPVTVARLNEMMGYH